jgi:ATP-dependent helicase Lhr and Lhr-like helicase
VTEAFDALHPALRYHMVSTLGWPDLRPAQAEVVEPMLAGENVLVLAPTAGGKTEAAIFPLLTRWASEKWLGLSILYVCPLKALLNNIAPRIDTYAGFVGARVGLWHGDIGEAARQRMLQEPPEILLTTPESIEAIFISARIDHTKLLRDVRVVVIDELHAFAGDDRGWHLMFLLARLEHLTRRQLQRVGLTATVGNPGDLLDWLSVRRGGRVIAPPRGADTADVTVDHVGSTNNAVTIISRLFRGERRLVFADSRARVEEIANGLRAADVRTFVSHASLSLDERRQAEKAFLREHDCVVVATSTMELGLDVGDLDRVIQVGPPPSVASFLQRMGRTGRRPGAGRNCLLLATNDEELLVCLALTTLWREGIIDPVVPPPRPAHIYAQQVMALILQEGGLTKTEIERWLGDMAVAVPASDRRAVLNHMLQSDIIRDDAGILHFGSLGEREFGRRHFVDLVATFSEPLTLTVCNGPAVLGTIHPSSLQPRSEDLPRILSLGGRNWEVVNVDWRRRQVSVAPSAVRGRSQWLGSSRLRPAALCRAAERIVSGLSPHCRLSNRAERALSDVRNRLQFVDGRSLPIVAVDRHRVKIWTFAGSAATGALATGLTSLGYKVQYFDDFHITVQSAQPMEISDSLNDIDAVVGGVQLPDSLPNALKFSICLPSSVVQTLLFGRLFDLDSLASLCSQRRKIVYLYD